MRSSKYDSKENDLAKHNLQYLYRNNEVCARRTQYVNESVTQTIVSNTDELHLKISGNSHPIDAAASFLMFDLKITYLNSSGGDIAIKTPLFHFGIGSALNLFSRVTSKILKSNGDSVFDQFNTYWSHMLHYKYDSDWFRSHRDTLLCWPSSDDSPPPLLAEAKIGDTSNGTITRTIAIPLYLLCAPLNSVENRSEERLCPNQLIRALHMTVELEDPKRAFVAENANVLITKYDLVAPKIVTKQYQLTERLASAISEVAASKAGLNWTYLEHHNLTRNNEDSSTSMEIQRNFTRIDSVVAWTYDTKVANTATADSFISEKTTAGEVPVNQIEFKLGDATLTVSPCKSGVECYQKGVVELFQQRNFDTIEFIDDSKLLAADVARKRGIWIHAGRLELAKSMDLTGAASYNGVGPRLDATWKDKDAAITRGVIMFVDSWRFVKMHTGSVTISE